MIDKSSVISVYSVVSPHSAQFLKLKTKLKTLTLWLQN